MIRRPRIGWLLALGLIAVLSLLLAAGCGDDDDDDNGDETPVATVDNGVPDGDEQAIQDTLDGAVAAWSARDVDAFLAFFTDAGVLASFDAPREAAEEFLAEFIGEIPISGTELTNIVVTDDTATADALNFAFGIVLDPARFSFLREGDQWLLDGEEDIPAEIPEGTTAVAVSLFEYEFAFEADEITSGNIAFSASNIGGDDHEIVLGTLSEDLTLDDLLAALEADEPPEGFEFIGVGGPWDPGTETDMVFTEELAPGRYAMICFIPTADGMPHAALGMIDEFTIE